MLAVARALTFMLGFATAAGLARSGVCSGAQQLRRGVCPSMPPAGGGAVRASASAGKSTVSSRPQNVLGGELGCCCLKPKTGFYRDGFCQTGEQDVGRHTVCSVVTDEFLSFSKARGNDLTRAVPGGSFPGLKGGDKWCLCVTRWKEALDAGVAPGVVLAATHVKALDFVSLEDLQKHAVE